MVCGRISLISSGGILLVALDSGKRGRLLFISVSKSVKRLKGISQGLCILQRITRFFLERALIEQN